MNYCRRAISKLGPRTASKTSFISLCAQLRSSKQFAICFPQSRLLSHHSFSYIQFHSRVDGDHQVHSRFRGHVLSFPAAPESNYVVRLIGTSLEPTVSGRKSVLIRGIFRKPSCVLMRNILIWHQGQPAHQGLRVYNRARTTTVRAQTTSSFSQRCVLIGVRCSSREQFRFKDIVDLETGETVMELEHEIRSYQHTG
eukprot:COSAG02_NODE_4605_length_5174_cov_18.935961_5_plen_197_part_00